ncbi:hypothetical protein Hypma_014456 [Hypsizygus marmoreus]|uniref:F-box domain-containing protein n=1 Tax=Hypsizygus marmoreus TaxID=39966 RepID=A0A369JJY6_HYPMA|nr:hypothetical protein Hypma_014456 [Hypsizygus marmoreus]
MANIPATPNRPVIPQDILNSVLDQLRHDSRTLGACALAARSLRPLSQQHMYASISLDLSFIFDSIQRVADLRDVLTVNPSLAENIHHLSLSVCDLRYMFGDDPSVIEDMGPVSLAVLSDTWAPIVTLRMLHRLHKLSVVGGFLGMECRAPTWDCLDEELRAFIYDQLRSPALVEISFDFVHGIPLDYFVSCAQLQNINLKDVTRSIDPESPTLSLPPQTGHLKSLSLIGTVTTSNFIDAMHTPGCSLSLTRLRELFITHVDSVICQAVLDMCAESLETFKLVLMSSADCDPSFMNLTHMKKLRSFHLNYHLISHKTGAGWLRNFLIVETHLPTAKGPLEKFTLEGGLYIHSAMWNTIDDILVEAPCLKNVHVCLCLPNIPATTQEASDFCQSGIPHLATRGNFSVLWSQHYVEKGSDYIAETVG